MYAYSIHCETGCLLIHLKCIQTRDIQNCMYEVRLWKQEKGADIDVCIEK